MTNGNLTPKFQVFLAFWKIHFHIFSLNVGLILVRNSLIFQSGSQWTFQTFILPLSSYYTKQKWHRRSQTCTNLCLYCLCSKLSLKCVGSILIEFWNIYSEVNLKLTFVLTDKILLSSKGHLLLSYSSTQSSISFSIKILSLTEQPLVHSFSSMHIWKQ